jgi:hypothetical protein
VVQAGELLLGRGGKNNTTSTNKATAEGKAAHSNLQGEFWMSKADVLPSKSHASYLQLCLSAHEALNTTLGLRFGLPLALLTLVEAEAANVVKHSRLPTMGCSLCRRSRFF